MATFGISTTVVAQNVPYSQFTGGSPPTYTTQGGQMLVFFSGSAYSSSTTPGTISVSLIMNNNQLYPVVTAQVWANTEDHMALVPVFASVSPQQPNTLLSFTLGLGENTIADNDVFNIMIFEFDLG